MKTWKKALYGVLAALTLAGTMSGCGKEEEVVIDKKVVELPPEEQILTDTYAVNPEITEYMIYTGNVATYIKNAGKTNETREVVYWKMFDVHTVQIDCMDLIYLGKSRMGDITNIVDKANKDAIAHATESVRAARQEILDKEYAEEKAKAHEKGKEFTKERPEADVSDLQYENPYRYVLAYQEADKKLKVQYPYVWHEYQGKKLIDPLKDPILYLFIYKYDVPYVQCTFESVNGDYTYTDQMLQSFDKEDRVVKLYNNLIDQEQDWVLTAINPADCTFLVDQELVYTEGYELPSYIDEDWNSKGSKNNMVTNGSIKFGGEGFTWDSLMTLCNALELNMKEKGGKSWRAKTSFVSNERASTYEQTSDAEFTYYTIYLPINQMFKQKTGALVCPLATIKVTFNKLTNDCVNWEIDYGRYYHCFPPSTSHEQTPTTIPVNIRQHQIDTTDYQGLLTTVDDWVIANKTEADFGYYFVDSTGLVIGKINEGLKDYQVSVSVQGETYHCVKPPAALNDMKAYYISETERQKLETAGTLENQAEVDKVAKLYYIMCMAVVKDEKGRAYPLGYFNNTGMLVDAEQQPSGYYIHSVEYDAQKGYQNAIIIDQEVFNKLMAMYVRTFRLSIEMQDNLETLYLEKDPWKMYRYMTEYVKLNLERRAEIEADIGSVVDDITKKPAITVQVKQGVLEIIDPEE